MRIRVRNQVPFKRQALKVQRKKPPVLIPAYTLLHQTATIQWVNVLFNHEDFGLTDLEILRHLNARFTEAALNGETTMVSSTPLMSIKPYCVSVLVAGTFETLDEVLQDAQVTVNRWIRELPIRGLPFNRNAIFNRLFWAPGRACRYLYW